MKIEKATIINALGLHLIAGHWTVDVGRFAPLGGGWRIADGVLSEALFICVFLGHRQARAAVRQGLRVGHAEFAQRGLLGLRGMDRGDHQRQLHVDATDRHHFGWSRLGRRRGADR